MVHRAVPVLSLAACAAAASSPYAGLHDFVKRQTVSGEATQQLQGLLDLAQQVIADAGSGNLTESCTSWAGQLANCNSANSADQVAVATCACNADILENMSSCAEGYGTTGQEDSDGFNSFCQVTLPSLTNSTVSSEVSSVAGSATSAISEISSAVSSASSASAASSTVDASATLSSDTPTIVGSTGGIVNTATTSSVPSATGTGAGSKVYQTGGLLGLVAAGVALLA
ncbi:hypothetical protein JCM8547_000560 [Rhodosporidiobolus lusitaniae]